MAISIHFHSFNRNFNVYSSDGTVKKTSTSNGGGLVHHIERDADDAESAKQATNSLLDTDSTQYNQLLIDKETAEQNLIKATKLIDERYEFLKSHQNSTDDYNAQLKDLQRKKDSTRKKLNRYKKKGYQKEKIDAVNTQLQSIKEQLTELKSSKKDNKSQYDNWSDDISTGYTATLQLSNEALATNGWQFMDSNGRLIDPGHVTPDSIAFSFKQQADYQKSHPDCHGIRNVKNAYEFAFNGGIKEHPEHYGAPIASSIHFDESSPHVDFMALAIGQDLDGKWLGHVGNEYNGTHDLKENIRTRTFINGTNDHRPDKKWTSQIQDRFSNDIRTGTLELDQLLDGKRVKNKDLGYSFEQVDEIMSNYGLNRGVKVDERTRRYRFKLKDAKYKADVASQMIDDAERYQTDTYADANLMLSNARNSASSITNQAQSVADNTTSKANAYLNSAVNTNSIAIKNSIASQSAYDALEASLKSSYAHSASIAQSSLESSYNSALSDAISLNYSSANIHVSNAVDSVRSSLATDNSTAYSNAINSGYNDGYSDGYNSGTAELDSSKTSLESSAAHVRQSLHARESIADANNEMVDGILSAIAPTMSSAVRSRFIRQNRVEYTNGSSETIGNFINKRLNSMATKIKKSSPTDFASVTNLQNVTSSHSQKHRLDNYGPTL